MYISWSFGKKSSWYNNYYLLKNLDMEGAPKNNHPEAANQNEAPASPEKHAESIERAKELYTELLKYNDVEILGEGAMEAKRYTEELALELTAQLKGLSNLERADNNLPQRSPQEKKLESNVTQFPATPPQDYVDRLGYTPKPSSDGSGVDQEGSLKQVA